MKLVNLAEAQVNLADLLNDVQNECVVVERNGQPLGVILSVADYQSWTGIADEELSALFARPKRQAKRKTKKRRTPNEETAPDWLERCRQVQARLKGKKVDAVKILNEIREERARRAWKGIRR